MREPQLTTVPRDLYYHEVAYVRKLEETLKAIVDCYGVGSTPERFCANVHNFIEEGRVLLAKGSVR